jgi:D-alanine-D-alanine ligase
VNSRQDESEFQVEYEPARTIELIKHGIEATGHEYVFIEANETFVENLLRLRPDLVFNRAEGIRGESRESHVPAMLEMLGIPYVGPNVLTTAIALDKTWTKKAVAYHGVKTPAFYLCSSLKDAARIRGGYPYILKPNEEGSSMGINEDNVVASKAALDKKLRSMLEEYHESILVEQFIAGREFSVGLLGRPGLEPELLPILEINFSKFPEAKGVFGQRAKTVLDSLEHYVCPAKIPAKVKARLERMSGNVWHYLNVRDFARMDYRMNHKGEIFFLEVNPLPGMDFDTERNDLSFFPFMAMKAGYTYDQLVRRLLESACSRYRLEL